MLKMTARLLGRMAHGLGLVRFGASSLGGIAVSFAITLPMVLGILGLASDYSVMTKVRGDLQAAADAAAMAGAREIPLAMSDVKQVASAVRAFAAYRLIENSGATAEDLAAQNLSLNIEVLDDFSAVKVSISESWTPFFAHFLSAGVTPVTVSSQARFIGRNNVCMLGLAASGTAVYLDKDSRLTGNNCGVFSNSKGSSGLRIDSGAISKATIQCSSGGAAISGSATVSPDPITDCPVLDDPLASRAAPNVGSCDYNSLVLKDVRKTLNPGVYCGGLNITGTSNVTLSPGIYIIRNGALIFSGSATVTGKGVGFFITGSSAQATRFTSGTHISLTAPVDGAMAGLLVFEDRKLTIKLKHKISSDDARTLLGTIYLPVGSLVVDAKKPVADQSAYTAIIAQTVELNFGPNLVLNADYNMTDVPVPAGIAGSSQVILSN